MPPLLLSMPPAKEEGPVVAVMEAAESAPLAVMVVAPLMGPASVMPPLLLSMPPAKEEGPVVAVMEAAESAPGVEKPEV